MRGLFDDVGCIKLWKSISCLNVNVLWDKLNGSKSVRYMERGGGGERTERPGNVGKMIKEELVIESRK